MLGEIGHVTGQKLLEDSSFLEKKKIAFWKIAFLEKNFFLMKS